MKFLCLIFVTFSFSFSFAQQNGFPFGQVTYSQFEKTILPRDSSAEAFVLKEFGEAYVSNDNKLIFEHHYIIKILKQAGVEEANVEIPLYKSGGKSEELVAVKAASYSVENSSMKAVQLNSKNVFTENRSIYADLKKFTIPNVRAGSIIEVQYVIESPFFVRNFKQWLFQSHLPKVESEYWATIPGNYNYNMSLKGFLKLTKNENALVQGCFDLGGGAKADCARYKFGMKNIPPFIEEDYMTASSNFIASINFELMEIKHFNGKVDKVTNEWKDADDEMKRDAAFGIQLKKGKDILQKIETNLVGISDSLAKAKKIYDFIKGWYRWDGYYGKYSEGIKKAFEAKKGSIGDINLSLIAAMRSADLDVESVLLSTRDNGLATELWPVLSDFNYVVAKLNIGSKVFLLDASDPFLPFGLLPERCLNGKGRVFSDKNPSYWYDLKPTDKYKIVSFLELKLEPTGIFTGTIQHSYTGYRALEKRKRIASFNSQDEYLAELKKNAQMTIHDYEVIGMDDLAGPVIEKLKIELEGFGDMNNNNFLLNPFITGKIARNPFQSTERLFPVDYGAPVETTIVLNLVYPASIQLESAPDKASFAIPNGGGRYLYDLTSKENTITINSSFSINKTVFTSKEYQYLKEFYNRVIETQSADILFKKKL